MDGEHSLTQLVAEQLQGKTPLVSVYGAAMGQQAGGLVDGDEMVVSVNDFEGILRHEPEPNTRSGAQLHGVVRVI